jgi:CheY-like chemotaxis protein
MSPVISNTQLAGRTILIVEDHTDTRNMLRYLFEGQAMKVELAGDGKIALNQIKRSRPDLVLLDIMMPQPGGVQVLQQLRDDPATADLPVILVTALSETQIINLGLPAYNGILQKGRFRAEELIDLVRDVLK